jgi:hypothetical protein
MEVITQTGDKIFYRGIEYMVLSAEISSDIVVLVQVYNTEYNPTIALVANETIINDVLQTSVEMLYKTITNG